MDEREGTPPLALVVHRLPGRTRLRVAGCRGQHDYFGNVASLLLSHRLVRGVSANPVTGSILIEHDGGLGAILSELDTKDLFNLVETDNPSHQGPGAAPRIKRTNMTHAAAGGVVLVGAYQAWRGRLLGTASESIWHAYNAWQGLRMPGVAVALLGVGLLQIARGQVLAPAASLFFYALTLRRRSATSGEPGQPQRPK